jgi:hypothetical protein
MYIIQNVTRPVKLHREGIPYPSHKSMQGRGAKNLSDKTKQKINIEI